MLKLLLALASDGVQDEYKKYCTIAMTGHVIGLGVGWR